MHGGAKGREERLIKSSQREDRYGWCMVRFAKTLIDDCEGIKFWLKFLNVILTQVIISFAKDKGLFFFYINNDVSRREYYLKQLFMG